MLGVTLVIIFYAVITAIKYKVYQSKIRNNTVKE